ncbi:alpha/beta fold hydrolase [Celeribacter sp.]|uniref:alpha/beta fold hydrolase n=1 Tax=Celeribacter sp. TaxID=1890673 RepID=UPI003A8F4D22
MTSGQDTGAPTWMFLPGTLCDARVFDPLMAALGPSFVGAGRVVPRINSASVADLAAHSVTGMADRFYVVGFSLGCQVAFEILRQYPERCQGVVLISTTARADLPEMTPVRRAMVHQFEQMGPREFVETQLWEKYVAEPKTSRTDIKSLVLDMASNTRIDDFSHQIELAITRPSSLEDLSHFTAPVLVINGAQDVLTPMELGEEIATAARAGTHKVISNAGHFVLLEQVQKTANAIKEWCET